MTTQIHKQVTWLVVTEVQSESFRLVCHYNACRIYASCSYVAPGVFFIVEFDNLHFLCSARGHAMHVFNVRASSSSPRLPLCKFFSCHVRTAELAPQRKTRHSITHLPSLFDMRGTEAYRFRISLIHYRCRGLNQDYRTTEGKTKHCSQDTKLTRTLTEPLCLSRDASAFLKGVGVLGVTKDLQETGVNDSHLTWLKYTQLTLHYAASITECEICVSSTL